MLLCFVGLTSGVLGAVDGNAASAAGSRCVATPYTGAVAAAGPGLDTTSLGGNAPASYEIGAPLGRSGAREGVKRVMILIHGGGWYVVGKRAMESERGTALPWRAAGWETISIDYRPCARSIGDALRFYDLIHARVGASVPICILGQSAGAHLALMIAGLRSHVACVIAEGAPTDLTTIATQGTAEAGSPTGVSALKAGAAWLKQIATSAFGRKHLQADSPVAHVSGIHARVLIGRAQNDWVIPWAQAQELAAALRRAKPGAYVDIDDLAPGRLPFTHGAVSTAAARDYIARVDRLVAPLGAGPGSLPTPPPLLG